MVTRWGMGSLGLAAFKSDDHQPFLGYDLSQGREYSEATAAKIDQEVQRLLEECHTAVRKVLTRERKKLECLVKALLQEETVTQDTLVEILGARPRFDEASRLPAFKNADDSPGGAQLGR